MHHNGIQDHLEIANSNILSLGERYGWKRVKFASDQKKRKNVWAKQQNYSFVALLVTEKKFIEEENKGVNENNVSIYIKISKSNSLIYDNGWKWIVLCC